MKKILFVIRDFKQGGIPRALQSLLQLIDTSKYEVDLLCLHQLGPYKGKMPNCKVLKQDFQLFHLLQFRKDYKKNILTYYYKFLNQLYKKLFRKSLTDIRLSRIAKQLNYRYDVVIAYSGGISSEIVQQIKGSKRLFWVHNDYAFQPARDDQNTDFTKFDNIVCVSKSAKKSFDNIHPDFSNKSIVIYNIINDKYIRESANLSATNPYDQENYNIVSIGRVSWQKNFIIIPEIIAKIPKEFRMKLRWHIIGNGAESTENELKKEIEKYKVQEQCLILGPKANPYPFIKFADLFVLTSIHESFCLVIHEARALGTPVLSLPIPVVEELCGKEITVNSDEMDKYILSLMQKGEKENDPISYEKHNLNVFKELEFLLTGILNQ